VAYESSGPRVVLHPNIFEGFDGIVVDTHVFLELRSGIPFQNNRNEHVDHDHYADQVERDKVAAGDVAVAAALDAIFFQAGKVLVVLALVEDVGASTAVPHDLIPGFAGRHSHYGEEGVPERAEVSMHSEPLMRDC